MQNSKIQVISITDKGRETKRYLFKNCNDLVEIPIEDDLPRYSERSFNSYKSNDPYFKNERKTRSIFGPLVVFPYRSVDLKPICIWDQWRLRKKQRRMKNEQKLRAENNEPVYKFKVAE